MISRSHLLLALFLLLTWESSGQSLLKPLGPSSPDDEELLALFEGLRVADVSDGMDVAGLRDSGLMSTRIQALWKDIDGFNHQFHGIAVTEGDMAGRRVLYERLGRELDFTVLPDSLQNR